MSDATPYPRCTYCGNMHNYSAKMCEDMLKRTTRDDAELAVGISIGARVADRVAADAADLRRDNERLRSELATERATHERVIESWKQEERGWDAERTDLSLRLEQMRGPAQEICDATGSDASDGPYTRLRALLSAPPGELAREVMGFLFRLREEMVLENRVHIIRIIDRLLAKLGGAG